MVAEPSTGIPAPGPDAAPPIRRPKPLENEPTMTSSAPPILSAENLTMAFSAGDATLRLFEAFDLEIPAGRTTFILGPSGSGKTTLLRALAGLVAAAPGGGVNYRGLRLDGPHPEIVLVAHESALDPDLTVRAAIASAAPSAAAGGGDDPAADMLEKVGLTEAADLQPYQLSRGMRQRAAIGQALIRAPAVLLFDEPFSAMDLRQRGRMQRLLIEHQEESGAAMVFATHDVEGALGLGDRILALGGAPSSITLDIDASTEAFEEQDDEAFAALRAQLEAAIR